MVGQSDPITEVACLDSPPDNQSTIEDEGVYFNMRSRTWSATLSQPNSPLHSTLQEEESNHDKCLAYAFLEITNSSQSWGISVNAAGNEVGSFFQRLKHQEDLAQQKQVMLEQQKVTMDVILMKLQLLTKPLHMEITIIRAKVSLDSKIKIR